MRVFPNDGVRRKQRSEAEAQAAGRQDGVKGTDNGELSEQDHTQQT